MLMVMIIIMIIFRFIVILNMMQYFQVSDSGECVNSTQTSIIMYTNEKH